MSNITPLHPANAARALALVASVPAPTAPVYLESLTREMPDVLGYALAIILSEFDLDTNQVCPTATALRLLATLIDRYEGALS